MKVTETTTQFTEALNVMNKAIQAHQDTIPYKQIFQASEKLADGLKFGAAVYKEDPSTPHDYYTVKFEDGQLQLLEHGKDDPEVTWKVSQDYLQQVTEDPDKYIQNPALLDFDWLKSRLGL